MRLNKAIVAVMFLIVAQFAFKTSVSFAAAAQSSTCSDSTVMNTILDTFDSASGVFQNLPQAKSNDDFAVIIDAGIVARQKISELKIDPTSPCFLAKVAAVQIETDQNDYATYALLAHLGTTNAATYQSNLDTIRSRLADDLKTFDSYTGLSSTSATAAATP